ncbi:unnamed protein product [Rotaria sordida]|uniref:NACHT domain-containing protein n=1 Tax=Rotaria sordida TaxID=392033 RepID=A0A815CGZ8_9BILA|nr:unnamed protein product [Rotaria sordida]
MASVTSIPTTIDDIIQRANEVKVCQGHFKLITTSLARLRNELNNTIEILHQTRSQQDLTQILKAINEIVTSCTQNENNLNGMTYKDLESMLFRLQFRLIQHEVNTKDDYQLRAQILSNAYQEQQRIMQKSFDEMMKESLEGMEKNTIEQLCLLREKHTKTIESYLRSCIELHQNESLTGLTGEIVAKVALISYQISFEDQTQLELKWRSCKLPLTRKFIQFKPDKSTVFERNESRRLLKNNEDTMLRTTQIRKEASAGIWKQLLSAPYMISMVERYRYSKENNANEETIIRTKRWISISGNAGSGKTSFVRQIVRQLAETFLLNEQHSTNYGPLRIPILIGISDFVEILKEQPSLTLFDYIGKHKWLGNSIIDDVSISIDDLSCALQDYIKQGQALIILDGLDQISFLNQRSKTIDVIQTFVDTYIQTPTNVSVFDNPYLSKLLDDPSRFGGNQIIITSRIVDYHAALAGQFAHYTIQPMNREHIKDFIDYWFFHVHQQIIEIVNSSIVNQGKIQSEALKKELEKPENVTLIDMASNIYLVSFICTLCFNQLDGSPLPTQRILLYDQIINSMLNLSINKRSTIEMSKFIQILSDIAIYIHDYSSSGLIDEEQMKDICIKSIKTSLDKTLFTEEDLQDIESQAFEFVRIIREDTGLLVARGQSLYGFLHLTFQEYFTCLKLIEVDRSKQKKFITDRLDRENEIQLIAKLLRHHTNDPRFRIPIVLALGKISSSWSQNDFDNVCYEFIQDEIQPNSLLPLCAFMLITCVNDFVKYPANEILFKALDCLMIAAGQHKWSIVSPFLFDQITVALKKFRNDIIQQWINNLLSRSSSHDMQTISSLCHFIEGKPHEFENIKWLNQSSCSILQSLSTLDNEDNEFAIDRLLVKIAFSNHHLLPIDPNTFKGFLLQKELEVNSIPIVLFPLIITLYGGLKRNDQAVIFDPSHIHRECSIITPILIRFFSGPDPNRQNQNLKKLQEECLKSFLVRMNNHDESSESIDLCIAIICFYNIEYLQDNLDIISNSLLRKCMNRLKYISMILRQFYFTADRNDRSMEDEITKFISTVIEKFQYVEAARIHFLDLLNSLRSSVARLRSSSKSIFMEGVSSVDKRLTLHLPNSLQKNNFLNSLLVTDIQFDSNQKSCSLLHQFTKLFWILEHNDEYDTQYRMAVAMDTIPQYLVFRNDEDLLFTLTFVPAHLRNLYIRLLKENFITINPGNARVDNKPHLYFGHILIECFVLLSNPSCKRLSILAAVIALLPWFRIHNLENFGSSLLWSLALEDSRSLGSFELKRQRPMDNQTGQYTDTDKNIFDGKDLTDEQRKTLIQHYIEQEYERLQNAKIENDENMKLYSASISLAHICRWAEDERRLSLLEQSINGAMSIENKIARLDALCAIAFYAHIDFDKLEVSRDMSLQKEIKHQFNEIYPDLPLLLHAAIFLRCLPLLQHSQTINDCLENLFSKFANTDQRDQQAVNEALLPYIQSTYVLSSITNSFSHGLKDNIKTIHNKSVVLKKYFPLVTHENVSLTLFISIFFISELTNDLHDYIKTDNREFVIDESIVTKLFQVDNCILTETQAFTITNILAFISLPDQSKQFEKLRIILSNVLHRMSWIELKARRLLESWLKWKNSNELSTFAYHAAVLLSNSNVWSIEVATIMCDILCSDNDRFRHRAEIIFRLSSDNDVRTSSTLGIDILLTLFKKKAHYQLTSASAKLTLNRMIVNTTLDMQFHLETILWLERYRIYALINPEYCLNKPRPWAKSYISSYFSTDIPIDACSCVNLCRLSNDLVIYMCDMIASGFFVFLEIDGDTTSDEVLESHTQFVASVILTFFNSMNSIDDTRQLAVDALMNLFDTSEKAAVHQAIAYTLGYVCNEQTHKTLLDRILLAMTTDDDEYSTYSNNVLITLTSSYAYCACINKIAFDQDDMELFCSLLKHPSQDVVRAARTGLARVLKDTSFLVETLGFDHSQCYHALLGATAYLFLYDVQQNSENNVADFIEKYPDLLPIFIVELYNNIRHFTTKILPVADNNYVLDYGYPQYVKVASLIAVRMPATFCAFIKDWNDEDNLKRALFYTSKQHNFPQRAACLTILSLLGELTVDLCEMFIEALHDDPHIQNTCYKCITHIRSIKDEQVVLNLLFSYLKSNSMNVRYVTAKLLLHLSQLSLIAFQQVQIILNDAMLDPSSNEDLWLIEEQDDVWINCIYYYAGPLKDVICSLLVQQIIGDANRPVRRNEFNDIDLDFIESEKSSRLASCLYETKAEEDAEPESPPTPTDLSDGSDG